MKAFNDDANKLLSEMDPNDQLTMRLREELRLTNEHFYNLMQQSLKGPRCAVTGCSIRAPAPPSSSFVFPVAASTPLSLLRGYVC